MLPAAFPYVVIDLAVAPRDGRIPYGGRGCLTWVSFMLDRLVLPALPILRGERVTLRGGRDSDIEDRLPHPIDPDEEDGYGSAWRREWDGRRYHSREELTRDSGPSRPDTYDWAIEYDGNCIGGARLLVDAEQHSASYSVGVFVADLRGRGLGREVTRLVVAWAFDVVGVHRIELEVMASNRRAIKCYLACGFRQEGIRRDAQLYPGGWKDFILMGLLQCEYAADKSTSGPAPSGAPSCVIGAPLDPDGRSAPQPD